MPISDFLEDPVSHLPALQLLQQVGYQYLAPSEALHLRGGKPYGPSPSKLMFPPFTTMCWYGIFVAKESSSYNTRSHHAWR
jgi:hypothetical protein